MTIKEAKAIDMVAYLSTQGYEPTKVIGNNYWYLSPLRNEKTPSFKVNRNRNIWYDFGEGKGGNLLDFLLTWKNYTIPDALQHLESSPRQVIQSTTKTITEPALEIIAVHPISSISLIRYYRSRRIHDEIANRFLQEIRYRNNGKTFYALGFKNDAGGYELRSAFFKGSSQLKAPTLIRNNGKNLAVFEGSFDFLSYCTICQNQDYILTDYLILNSTSFFESSLPIMQAYQQINLFLDNDKAGNKYSALALSLSPKQFVDQRNLYKGYKDINEWQLQIGKANTT